MHNEKRLLKSLFGFVAITKLRTLFFFYLNSTAQAIIRLSCGADSQKCKNDLFSIGHRGVEENEYRMPIPGRTWNICSYRAGGYGNQRGHPYVDVGQTWTKHIDDMYILQAFCGRSKKHGFRPFGTSKSRIFGRTPPKSQFFENIRHFLTGTRFW